MRVATIVTLIFMILVKAKQSLQDPCTSHRPMPDSTRSVFFQTSSVTNDRFVTGWYRFTGAAGDRILYYQPRYQNGRCAAVAQGWMNGEHPTVSQGAVTKQVCFSYGSSSCYVSSTIAVKNCGSFFVYWLRDVYTINPRFYSYMRYCTSGEVDPTPNPCLSHNVLSDKSRSIRYVAKSASTSDHNVNGWYRLTGDAGDQIIRHEPRWASGVYRCSSLAQGWLYGTNPSPSAGKVKRKFCFSYSGNKCWFSTEIQMQNCGNFYVYWLKNFYYYAHYNFLRYCGVGRRVDLTPNPCSNHSTLSDESRSVLNVENAFTNDHGINGWYRFYGKAGKKLIQYQPRWKSAKYRCKAKILGWMQGKSPSVAEGKVNKTVCFVNNGKKCWYQIDIKVQNCGAYNVYWLEDLYHYTFSDSLRYCGTGEYVDTNPNPCTNHSRLFDQSRSVLLINESYTDDHDIDGWYRFMGQAGNRMLDYDIDWKSGVYRCKAKSQGWMVGKRPRGSEGKVNRTVCFTYNGDNCWIAVPIKIRNCGDYYVYWLHNMYHFQYSQLLRYCGAGETANNFPCKHYQMLIDGTRLNTYHDRANRKCDNYLEGWYRFWGEAGHQLLNFCPKRPKDNRFSCGSIYQGWSNMTNPNPIHEVVNRTVCFSYFYECRCQFETKIKVRNCGDYFVYNFEAVKCSGPDNARYCGIKDKDAYQVTCSANYMRIDLDRLYYNASRYKGIVLRHPNCGHTLSYDYISLGSVPSLCGSERQETKKEIIYTNYVTLKARFRKGGLVGRDHDETIKFKCIYSRDSFIDNGGSFAPVGKIEVNDSNVGEFSFNMNVFTKSSYDKAATSYPIKLKLRDWLYFEVNATIDDDSLVLLIDKCYSTPTMDREHPLKYQFILDGCAQDNTVQFIPSIGVKRRFSMQAFRYKNATTIYIHCVVFLCRTTSTDSRCFQGCYGNKLPGKRRRRDISSGNAFSNADSSRSGYYLLDTDQIALDQGIKESKIEEDGKSKPPEVFGVNIMTIAIGVIVIGMIALVIAIIIVLRRKSSKRGAATSAKEIGLENRAMAGDNEGSLQVTQVSAEVI